MKNLKNFFPNPAHPTKIDFAAPIDQEKKNSKNQKFKKWPKMEKLNILAGLPAISFGRFLVHTNWKVCRENFGRDYVIALSQSATFILKCL